MQRTFHVLGREMTEKQLKELSLAEAETLLANHIYAEGSFIEVLEGRGKVWGNGHHARQYLASYARHILRSRWKDEAQKKEQEDSCPPLMMPLNGLGVSRYKSLRAKLSPVYWWNKIRS